MPDPWLALDRATRAWVRATGRTADLRESPWLDGPAGDARLIADEWLVGEACRLDGQLIEGGGLLGSVEQLRSAVFDPTQLDPRVVDFYEHTTAWRIEVWSQWCPAALPFGWLLSTLFGRRLRQLAMPLRPLDTALGMDSRVTTVRSPAGEQLGAAWLRTLRSTGQVVYSGWYGVTQLPVPASPSVRVAFPLPHGSVTVFLKPSIGPRGSLLLTSPIGRFGDDGAYLIVRNDQVVSARRVPIDEQFHVYVDDEGTLRTDHALRLGTIPALKLHYRLQPGQAPVAD